MDVTLSKIEHRGETRILLSFKYSADIVANISTITGAAYSNTYGKWHIPYTRQAFDHLLSMYPEVEYPNKQEDTLGANALDKTNGSEVFKGENTEHSSDVSIEVAGRKIFLKMPMNQTDIQFLRSIRYSRWNKKQYVWEFTNYPGNLDLLQSYFKQRITHFEVHATEIDLGEGDKRVVENRQFVVIKSPNGRMKIIFGYNKAISDEIKKLPLSRWDAKNQWWTLPYSDNYLHKIKELAIARKFEFIYEEESKKTDRTPRLKVKNVNHYKQCPVEYLAKLQELRYSTNTQTSYKNAFEEFINYHHKTDIDYITEPMIIAFLRYLVMERSVSESYQNIMINAIKFYYERVLGGQRKIYLVERPLRETRLPVVLSTSEITAILTNTLNIKHKALLMVINSAGLRISEALELKINDIDSDRMQIRIADAKGNACARSSSSWICDAVKNLRLALSASRRGTLQARDSLRGPFCFCGDRGKGRGLFRTV
jgi:integrase